MPYNGRAAAWCVSQVSSFVVALDTCEQLRGAKSKGTRVKKRNTPAGQLGVSVSCITTVSQVQLSNLRDDGLLAETLSGGVGNRITRICHCVKESPFVWFTHILRDDLHYSSQRALSRPTSQCRPSVRHDAFCRYIAMNDLCGVVPQSINGTANTDDRRQL